MVPPSLPPVSPSTALQTQRAGRGGPTAPEPRLPCRAQLTQQDVERGIAERDAARKAKDFARGDGIRAELADKGIMLCDGPTGTTWRPGARLEPEKASV